jgi:hypothetical protein
VRFWREQRESLRLSKDLVEPLSTSQLTNQQFINCAYLEILLSMSPWCLWCLCPVPVPSTSMYRTMGTLVGTGQTKTMEVSDSLTI